MMNKEKGFSRISTDDFIHNQFRRKHRGINFLDLISKVQEKPEIPGLFARVCRSELCENELNKVKKGKEIWLDYSSDLKGVMTAKLIYPDGTSKKVELPEEKKLSQIGEYELRITGSKKGYKDTEDSYSFKVEETIGERNDGKENESWLIENALYLIFGIGIVVLIIIFFSLFPRKN